MLEDTFARLRQDIRLNYIFAGKDNDNFTNKKIYVKSSWNPPSASQHIEHTLRQFEQEMLSERQVALDRLKATNLSQYQFSTLQHLRANNNVIVLIYDKNLSAAVMIRETYIRDVLLQHLLDDKGTYRQLTEAETISRMVAIKIRMVKIVSGKLTVEEQK